MKPKILAVCSYGETRSVAMSNAMRELGYDAVSAGVVETDTGFLEWLFDKKDVILICNRTDFGTNGRQEHAEFKTWFTKMMEDYKNKVIYCEFGIDIWGDPFNPKLVNKARKFAKSIDRRLR